MFVKCLFLLLSLLYLTLINIVSAFHSGNLMTLCIVCLDLEFLIEKNFFIMVLSALSDVIHHTGNFIINNNFCLCFG